MKSFIVFALFVAAAVAAPANPDADAEILLFENDNIGVQGYSYGAKTSNGISTEERGRVDGEGTENEALEVEGGFSYTGPDGVLYSITYTAGKDGFVPQGAHIPQA